MISIIYGVVALSLLILVHELGHYLVARLFKVKVLAFSLGFGKKILSFRRGDTEYALSAVPLGGYVKLLGESPDEEVPEADKSRSFSGKPPIVRIFIAVAGPLFNLLFALLLFWIILFSGYNVQSTKVGSLEKGYPAYEAGVREGDVILAIEGRSITEFEELRQVLSESAVRPLRFTVRRDGKTMEITITPKEVEGKNIFGDPIRSKLIGVGPSSEFLTKHESFGGAIQKAVAQTYNLSALTVIGIGKLIQGSVSRKEIGGPIMILQMAGKQAKQGKSNFVYFIAFISINLGILNLCPIPVLDGGHILFNLVEIIIRRRVPEKVVNVAQYVGLALIIALMVVAVGNDLDRNWQIYDRFGKIFGGN